MRSSREKNDGEVAVLEGARLVMFNVKKMIIQVWWEHWAENETSVEGDMGFVETREPKGVVSKTWDASNHPIVLRAAMVAVVCSGRLLGRTYQSTFSVVVENLEQHEDKTWAERFSW